MSSTVFQDAIRAAGLTPPDTIEPGRFYHFPGEGKRGGNTAGWCKLYPDGLGGVFGDFSTDLSEGWQADRDKPMNAAERDAWRKQIEEAKAAAEADRIERQGNAAKRAAELWKGAAPAPADHPYLAKKGISPHGVRIYDGRLVVPVRYGADLVSLQFIGTDGDKRFLTDGRTGGGYFSIGKPVGLLCIAEGFATGASIHEATGHAVAVAFNAGNLGAVAKAMREKFPRLSLILCADDDNRTEGNPGITKATEAARSVGGLVAVPDFGADRPEDATDMNDLAALNGLEAVKDAIENAKAPAIGEPQPAREDATGADLAQPDTDGEAIKRLAMLSPLEYDRARKDAAALLKVRPGTLDRMVTAARKSGDDDGMEFVDVEPWPSPVEPAALLSEISATVRRFIVCQQETADAVALWAAMTWFMDVVQIAPLAVITAPEKRCGKSQLLFLLGRLSHRPLTASSISPAAMFRAVDAWRPTLLVDEADSFMRDNEELRGIINAGHTRDSAYVVRVVGDDLMPQKFSVWGAKALAGIGHLADTLMDRAVVLELRRKLPNEEVERLRHAAVDLFEILTEKLARFADDYREAVRQARPALPASLNDRAQDNWEPLLAIAGVAGGAWPDLGRRAALKLSGSDSPTMSTGTELLADIQEIFETRKVDRISTADLIAALCDDDERPWATYNRGKPISPRQVSRKLSEYSITSTTIRIAGDTPKGFLRRMFEEAFSRYLASPPPATATPPQTSNGAAPRVADYPQRCGNETQSATAKPLQHQACGGVADSGGGVGEKIEVEL
jgi:putative DNA primase/helicase